MKRALSVLLAALLLIGALPLAAVAADDDEFDIVGGVLRKYNGPGGDVVIPDGVTTIADAVFSDCTGLTEIHLPDTLTRIQNSAFHGCTGLTSVTIPGSVTFISDWAFAYCTGLTSITIPGSVTTMGRDVFNGCTALKSITFEKGITSIGSELFMNCTGLMEINLPDTLTTIGNLAFHGCTGLTSVTIPGSVTSMGEAAFQDCTGLKSVTLEEGITSIGREAFEGCTGLVELNLPDSLTSLGIGSFRNCTSLTSVTIPGSVQLFSGGYIDPSDVVPDSPLFHEEETFAGCEALTEVIYAEGITGTGHSTFSGCKNLKKITFPSTLKTISPRSFEFTGLEEIVIPEGVTVIGTQAFEGCSNLKSVTLPDTLEWIRNSTFAGTALTEVAIPDNEVFLDTGSFKETRDLKVVTIPVGCSVTPSAFVDSGVTDVCYSGTRAQWDKEIGKYLTSCALTTAKIHCGSTGPVGGFADVTASQFCAEPVVWAVENGITSGTGAASFSPSASCTRAQIATFLWRFMGEVPASKPASFTDMTNSATYNAAISWAVESGVTAGTSATTFSPSASCTRAQAVTFLWRAAGRPEPKAIASFADMPKAIEFQKAISWAKENGITTGTSATAFSPNKTCNRGEIVTFLHRAKDLIDKSA